MTRAGESSSQTASDLRWPRRALFAALAAAVAASAVVAATPASSSSAPGALSPAHIRARAACSSCHAEGGSPKVAASACVACHGAHPSTRAGHRRVIESLACPTCHAIHAAPAPVAVTGGSVPRVPLAACAPCHDASRADDPVRACIGTGTWANTSVCFDEHQTPSVPLPVRGACAREHGADRFVVWDQVRAEARTWPNAPSPSERPTSPWRPVGAGAGTGAIVFLLAGVRRKERRKPGDVSALAPPERIRLPRIDTLTCLGCRACVDACPFGALAVDQYVASLTRPDACCGVGACEQVCPNGSLRVVEQAEPMPDRPVIDAHFESLDRPGVFVVGDLTGIPLIRNAIAQGAAVADRIATTLVAGARAKGSEPRVDVVIVGSGPAGLACALRAGELGLACVVLEQGELAASIRSFPRAKIVQDARSPLELPAEGPLWFQESTKEELVGHWTRVVRTHRVDVRVRHRVMGVEPDADGFVVSAESPDGPRSFRGARVVLATGRRGTPRALDAEVVPGALGRVMAALSDARSWADKRVLVVGLGDAALEAVVALARQPRTRVTVAYRGRGFARGSARNVDAVRRLVEAGRVRILFETRVTRVEERTVTVVGPGGSESLPVDGVLALLGGEPSRVLLRAAGVRLSGPEPPARGDVFEPHS